MKSPLTDRDRRAGRPRPAGTCLHPYSWLLTLPESPFRLHPSSFILHPFIILCLFLLSVPAFPQGGSLFLDSAKTLIPGTTYNYPSGNKSAASGWLGLTEAGHAAQYFNLLLAFDSVAGYGSACSTNIRVFYGVDQRFNLSSDSLLHVGYPDSGLVYSGPAKRNTAFNFYVPAYAHMHRRYQITVTDTVRALHIVEHTRR